MLANKMLRKLNIRVGPFCWATLGQSFGQLIGVEKGVCVHLDLLGVLVPRHELHPWNPSDVLELPD